MSYLLRNTFKFGNVVYPLATGTGNDLILDADPAITWILKFLETVINKYCGAAWTERVAAANLTNAAGALIASPVVQLVPFHPADYFQDEQFKFPLLSLDRVSGEYKEIANRLFEAQTTMELLFILPPLSPEQMYQIAPFRKMVRDTILDRLMLEFDPSFMNGAILYEIAGFDMLNLLSENWLKLENPKTNQVYETYMMRFTLRELKGNVAGAFPNLTAVDGQVDVSDGYQPNNFDLINFKLNLP